jgi:hypothetical protein
MAKTLNNAPTEARSFLSEGSTAVVPTMVYDTGVAVDVTHVDLAWYNLGSHRAAVSFDEYLRLIQEINTDVISSLDISFNQLSKLDKCQLEELFKAIGDLNIKKLALGHNGWKVETLSHWLGSLSSSVYTIEIDKNILKDASIDDINNFLDDMPSSISHIKITGEMDNEQQSKLQALDSILGEELPDIEIETKDGKKIIGASRAPMLS